MPQMLIKRMRTNSISSLDESLCKASKHQLNSSPRSAADVVQLAPPSLPMPVQEEPVETPVATQVTTTNEVAWPSVKGCDSVRYALMFLQNSRQHAMGLVMQNHWDRALNVLEKIEKATESVCRQRRKVVVEQANAILGMLATPTERKRSVRFSDDVIVVPAEEMDRSITDIHAPEHISHERSTESTTDPPTLAVRYSSPPALSTKIELVTKYIFILSVASKNYSYLKEEVQPGPKRRSTPSTMATAPSFKTCSLEELKKEPWRLQHQADNTAEELRNLVMANYHMFIRSNQCSAIVKDDLGQLKDQTNDIMNYLPELKEHCGRFQREIADVVTKHGDIQFVFEHYLQLTELLEIPQLLEACIHNELFDSALDVIQFSNELFKQERTDATPNFIIATLIREVSQMVKVLREKLLQKLREDLQLALCVRIVGYLRRLDSLSWDPSQPEALDVSSADYEKKLKEEFLACRNVWLSSLTRGISHADPYQYTIQVIDVKRTSWFDMITQYSAIFGSENIDGQVDPPLCHWATATVAEFIQILMKQLPKIDDFSSLATILEQSLFFGGSLGRVGVDFRAILAVYFEDHVFDLLSQNWRNACRDFQEGLNAHALSAARGGGNNSQNQITPIVIASYRSSNGSMATAYSLGSSNSLLLTKSEEDYSPPRSLMSFPLLAEFTNALLSSLNELRLCTISSLHVRLAKRFQSVLCTMLLCVAEFCEDNRISLKRESDHAQTRNPRVEALTDAIREMIKVIQKEFLPYIIKCFRRLYPPTAKNPAAASNACLSLEYFEGLMQESGLFVAADDDKDSTSA
ncbi:TPA: LOW QUALITY PROTEIN: hypothetical protein N0F65_009363 [Lagenidium giganteum]|uniref:Conserved oligomeric Golgi complex subunit 8 n=1 Tax=Lagenidium giganteum TaxID=4803 RepID=A0AAV2Z9C2_9STRA|nr:TPA: LOW QUALITY PROTEIN: hypothetical protein N0F65_009363 [Lagenidium giganteum]